MKSAWSTNRQNCYSEVNVLLVSWKDDDLHVSTEIADLGFLFTDQYGYHVQKYEIPSLKPDRALKERVLGLLKEFDKDHSLLIFYYAGHARRSPQSNGAPIWIAYSSPSCLEVLCSPLLVEIEHRPQRRCLLVESNLF